MKTEAENQIDSKVEAVALGGVGGFGGFGGFAGFRDLKTFWVWGMRDLVVQGVGVLGVL